MKGKIDASGNLWIERTGKWVAIQCNLHSVIFNAGGGECRHTCNHACRWWGEPWTTYDGGIHMRCGGGRGRENDCWLDIFDELTDERVKP